MPNNIYLGGARVVVSLDTAGYAAGVRQTNAQNARLVGGFTGIHRSVGSANATLAQFGTSLRSTLIATAAYAAGIGLIRSVTRGTVSDFLAWETALVRVQKTTNLTDVETARLSDSFERLLTTTSALGRPLPITSRSLSQIAEVAGQMRIVGVPAIREFTEQVALLELTSDLAGTEAANALGLIVSNTDATVGSVDKVVAALTALGNRFRGGERDILLIAEDIARSTAEFNLSSQAILSFSAVFAQAGARAEKTGTVFQRSIRALVNAASEAASGEFGKLAAVADAAGVSIEHLQTLIQERNFPQSLRVLADALNNLPDIAGATSGTRGGLLTTLFGGETPPVRIAEILGVLAENVDQVDRAFATSTEQFEDAFAALEEAGRFAEANALRLLVVRNQLEAQSRVIGEGLTSVVVPLAENFKALEVAALAVAVAFVAGFGRRRIEAFQSTSRGLRDTVAAAKASEQAALRSHTAILGANNARLASEQRLTAAEAQRTALLQRRAQTELTVRASIGNAQAAEAARSLELSALNQQIARQERVIGAERRIIAQQSIAADAQRVASLKAVSVASGSAAAAQAAYNTQVAIGARIVRAATATFAFFGGWPGIILAGLIALPFAFRIFRKDVEETVDVVDGLVDQLDALTAARRKAGDALTDEGRLRADAAAQLEEQLSLRNRLQSERSALVESIRTASSGFSGSVSVITLLRRNLRELQDEYDGVVSGIRRLRDSLSAASTVQITAADDADTLGERFEALALTLESPATRVRQFVENLQRSTRLLTAQARFEGGIAGRSEFDQQLALTIQERQNELAAERLRLEDALAERVRMVSAGSGNIATLRQQLTGVDASSKAAQEINQQIETALDQQVRLLADQVLAQRFVSEGQQTLLLSAEQILEFEQQITAERQSQADQVIRQPRERQFPDFQAEAVRAQDFLRDFQLRVLDLQRTIAQESVLGAVAPGDQRSTERARLEILNRFANERRASVLALNDALREQMITERQLALASAELRMASGDEQDVAALRGRVQALQGQAVANESLVVTTRAYTEELAKQQPDVERLAELYGQLTAEQLEAARQTAVSEDLFRAATELAESGVRALEDALVQLSREGRISFGKLAQSIIEDLVRILVRATITTRALRALGVGPEGGLTQGGFLGNLLGGGAPASEGHSGGLIGQLPRRTRGALSADERVVVVRMGEELLTRGDPRHRYNLGALRRFHEGGVVGGQAGSAGSGAMNVSVRLVNEGRTELELEEPASVSISGDDIVVSAIIRDATRRGPGTQALSAALTSMRRR